MTAFPFVLVLAALFGWYLMNTLRRARQGVEPAPVRYEVRARAFCPHCGEAVTSGYLDKLRAELGRASGYEIERLLFDLEEEIEPRVFALIDRFLTLKGRAL